MPGERLSMRKIREVLRLRLGEGLPQQAGGQSRQRTQGTVNNYVARAQRAGLTWPLPDGLDDAQLARAAALSTAGGRRWGRTPGSRLGSGAPRVAATERYLGAAWEEYCTRSGGLNTFG